jgi:hypothetical protein
VQSHPVSTAQAVGHTGGACRRPLGDVRRAGGRRRCLVEEQASSLGIAQPVVWATTSINSSRAAARLEQVWYNASRNCAKDSSVCIPEILTAGRSFCKLHYSKLKL